MISRSRNRTILIIAFLFLGSIGIAIVGNSKMRRTFEAPLSFLSGAVSLVAHLSSVVQSTQSLLKENNDLRSTMTALSLLVASCHEVSAENNALRAEALYHPPSNTTAVTAGIVGWSTDPFQNALFLNRGSADHIEVGAPVLVGNGIFIGNITKIWSQSALVTLATDPASRIPAKVVGRDSAIGILEGQGPRYELTLLPRSAGVSPHDLVVTDAHGTITPGGISIGIVISVSDSQEGPFRTALVDPLASVRLFPTAFVLLSRISKEK